MEDGGRISPWVGADPLISRDPPVSTIHFAIAGTAGTHSHACLCSMTSETLNTGSHTVR